MRSLSVAATGMIAQQLHVEVIANNIANVTTTGFKKRRPEFQDLLYQTERRVGADSSDVGTVVPAGVHIGLGVKPAAVYRVHDQGNLVSTDNDLDLAIQGRGYFLVEMPSGETAYTRAGSFQLSPEGLVVTPDGYTVGPGLLVPEDALSVTVNPEGVVQAALRGQTEPAELGRLELATFANEAGLEPIGGNLMLETASSGAALVAAPGEEGFGTLLQGHLEGSNVNPVAEITNLITAQRAYELNSRVISASDEMMSTVTQMR